MADEQDGRATPSMDEVHGWLDNRNNWGRWGDDDQVGAVNLIDARKRVEALGMARTGRVVSISRPYPKEPGPTNPTPAQHFIRRGDRPYRSGAVVDYYGFIYHGHNHTHLDALSHVWDHRGGWQGRNPDDFLLTVFAGLSEPYVRADGSARAALEHKGVDRLILLTAPPYYLDEIREAGRMLRA